MSNPAAPDGVEFAVLNDAARAKGTPFDLYANLRAGDPDPLPPLYTGTVYHYTDANAAISIINNDEVWASHIGTLNDAAERNYGWRRIVERLVMRRDDFDERFARGVEEAWTSGHRLPEVFIVSASTCADHLPQFVAYGMYEVGLRSGHWYVPDHPTAPQGPRAWAAWRPVLYGPQAGDPYVDILLDSLNRLHVENGVAIDACLRWLDHLACLIKDPSFSTEQEVRLVYPSGADSFLTHHRAQANHVIPYVVLRPGVEGVGCLSSLRLGPVIADSAAVLGAKSLLARIADYGDIEVEMSGSPYRSWR